MATAQLLVERGSYKDKSRDWGSFDFLALPSPGDRLAVEHEGETHFLTVLCVHHQPSRIPDGGGPVAEPASAAVVAKWTGSED